MTWNDEIAGTKGPCSHVHILDFYVLEFGSLIFIYLSCLLYLLDYLSRCLYLNCLCFLQFVSKMFISYIFMSEICMPLILCFFI